MRERRGEEKRQTRTKKAPHFLDMGIANCAYPNGRHTSTHLELLQVSSGLLQASSGLLQVSWGLLQVSWGLLQVSWGLLQAS